MLSNHLWFDWFIIWLILILNLFFFIYLHVGLHLNIDWWHRLIGSIELHISPIAWWLMWSNFIDDHLDLLNFLFWWTCVFVIHRWFYRSNTLCLSSLTQAIVFFSTNDKRLENCLDNNENKTASISFSLNRQATNVQSVTQCPSVVFNPSNQCIWISVWFICINYKKITTTTSTEQFIQSNHLIFFLVENNHQIC